MRKITTNFATFLFATLLICTNVNCKKDKDEEKNKSKTELLASGQWHITAFSITPGYDWDGDGTIDTDIYSVMEPCEKDNYFVFDANGTYESNEGTTKCYAGDPQTDSGTWAFAENETEFRIDGESYKIEELTSNKFRISYTESGESVIITLSK